MNIGLTEEQSKMIELVIKGRNITDIAGIVHKSRTTIYNWLELDVVKEELENRRTEMKKAAKDRIATEANSCIDEIVDMAHNCKDNRIRFQANRYLVDHYLGAPSSKELNNDDCNEGDSNKIMDIDAMLAEIKEMEVEHDGIA